MEWSRQHWPVLLLLLLLAAPLAGAQTLVVARPAPDIAVYGEPTIDVQPGEWTIARLVVQNRGNITEALRFGVMLTSSGSSEGSAPLTARATPSTARLEPNATVEVTIEVGAYPSAAEANWTLVLDIAGPSGMPLRQVPLSVHVAPAPTDAALPSSALAGVAGVAAVAAGAWALRRVEWLRFAALAALSPLYTRLATSELLGQERREAIYRIVEQEPGISFSEILARSRLPNGVLVHHLRTLERHRLVASRREGMRRRFAITGVAFPAPGPKPLTAMQERVLGLLSERPRTQREIAEALGLSQQGANRHVKALERRGALRIAYAEGEWRCHAVPDASAASAHNARSPITP